MPSLSKNATNCFTITRNPDVHQFWRGVQMNPPSYEAGPVITTFLQPFPTRNRKCKQEVNTVKLNGEINSSVRSISHKTKHTDQQQITALGQQTGASFMVIICKNVRLFTL